MAPEPNISWHAIAGVGNVLRHDYHDNYPTVFWDTCNKDGRRVLPRRLLQRSTKYKLRVPAFVVMLVRFINVF